MVFRQRVDRGNLGSGIRSGELGDRDGFSKGRYHGRIFFHCKPRLENGQISGILSHPQFRYGGAATLRIGPGDRKDIERILHRLPKLCRRLDRSRF
jgi:hypothetical protein